MSEISVSSNTVTLPPGVSIVAQRETSRTGANGTVEQGMLYTLQTPQNTQTSVFIPYSILGNTLAVAAAFNKRLAELAAVNSLQS